MNYAIFSSLGGKIKTSRRRTGGTRETQVEAGLCERPDAMSGRDLST
jgi:hypothetical protein